jgi:hypothetical protein
MKQVKSTKNDHAWDIRREEYEHLVIISAYKYKWKN